MDKHSLLLPPKEIDLSQATLRPFNSAETSRNPTHEFRDVLIELLEGLKTATAGTFEQQKAQFDSKIDSLIVNINASLNDLDRRLEGTNQNLYDLEQVVDSLLKMQLLGETMPEEMREQHQAVIAKFLRNNATMTVINTDSPA